MKTIGEVSQKFESKKHFETYEMIWDLDFLDTTGTETERKLQYSNEPEKNYFRSGKKIYNYGLFAGPGKYTEFFIYLKEKQMDVYVNICYPTTRKRKEFFEVFGVSVASVSPIPLPKPLVNNIGKTFEKKVYLSEINIPEQGFPNGEDFDVNTTSTNKILLKATFKNEIWNTTEFVRLLFTIDLKYEKFSLRQANDLDYSVIPASKKRRLTANLSTEKYLFSSDYSDAKIHCMDKTYDVHQIIICDKSNVLRTMFAKNMLEKKTGELYILDSEPRTVEEFLRFIYTGSVHDLAQNAVGLFHLADKYDVQDLKSISEGHIVSSITNENVLDRFAFGKLMSSQPIMNVCIDTIIKNKNIIWKTKNEFSQDCQKFPELIFDLF